MDAGDFFLLIVLPWLGWSFLGVWAVRAALTRWVFRFDPTWMAYAASYAVIAALGFAALSFVDFSGWHLKSHNDEPMQRAGEIVLFFSPFGLTLWIGGPAVIFRDLIMAWRRSEGYI